MDIAEVRRALALFANLAFIAEGVDGRLRPDEQNALRALVDASKSWSRVRERVVAQQRLRPLLELGYRTFSKRTKPKAHVRWLRQCLIHVGIKPDAVVAGGHLTSAECNALVKYCERRVRNWETLPEEHRSWTAKEQRELVTRMNEAKLKIPTTAIDKLRLDEHFFGTRDDEGGAATNALARLFGVDRKTIENRDEWKLAVTSSVDDDADDDAIAKQFGRWQTPSHARRKKKHRPGHGPKASAVLEIERGAVAQWIAAIVDDEALAPLEISELDQEFAEIRRR